MISFIQIFSIGCLAMIAANAFADDTTPEAAKKKTSRDECVFFSSVYDWRALDETNMVLWAPNKGDAYLVALSRPLIGLRFANALAFIDGNDDRLLCSYGRDAIGTDKGNIPEKSSIHSIKKLDPEGIAKLEEKYKVNLNRDKKKKIPKEPPRETAE